MTESASSESVEMYLKTVAELGGEHGPVPIGRVAKRMGVSPVSANEMMKRLGEQRLIQHQMYKGVSLTDDGRRLANSVIRRQRLWECFLVDHLKLDWARVRGVKTKKLPIKALVKTFFTLFKIENSRFKINF